MMDIDADNHSVYGNRLACPKCRSKNVACFSDNQAHTHSCHDCGYELVAAPVRR